MGSNIEAHIRHGQHYAFVVRNIADFYKLGGDDVRRAFHLLHQEWPQIKAAQSWAASCSGDEDSVANLCSYFALVSPRGFLPLLQPQARISFLEPALKASRRRKNRSDELAVLVNLATVYGKVGEMGRASECYGAAFDIARQEGDREAQGYALLGLASCRTGTDGIHLLNRALAIADDCEYFDLRANVLMAMGENNHALGQYRCADECYQKALAAARKDTSCDLQAAVLSRLGQNSESMAECDQAERYYEDAVCIGRNKGDAGVTGQAFVGLAHLYKKRDSTKAVAYFKSALRHAREYGDEEGEVRALLGLANMAQDNGQTKDAVDQLESALVLAQRCGDRRREVAASRRLAVCYDDLGQHSTALTHYEHALAVAHEINYREGEQLTLAYFSRALAKSGELTRALELSEQALDLARGIGEKMAEANSLWNAALILRDVGNLSKARKYADAACAILQDTDRESVLAIRQAIPVTLNEKEHFHRPKQIE